MEEREMSAGARLRKHTGLVALVALMVVSAVYVAGCGGSDSSSSSSSSSSNSAGEAETGGTMRLSQGEEVASIEPLKSITPADINVVNSINEPLFKVNSEEKLVPWLVDSYQKSADQRVWTLHLKPGIEFSTGKPLTASDVVFTLEQARKSEFWEALLEGIQSVKASSPSTVVITNAKPAPELSVILSQWSFGVVPDNYGGVSEKQFAQHPVGTGPFMLTAWKPGETITLEKNPHYWRQGLPHLEKLVLQSVPDANSRVSQLRGGQLEAIMSPPWSQVDALESQPGIEVGHYPLGFVEYLTLNSRFPLFKNPRVREAVSLAIDREGIINAALNGEGKPAGAWVPPPIPDSNQNIKPDVQDVEKAKALLAEAVKEGADPSFTLIYTNVESFWITAIQIVQQDLEEVGFKVQLQSLDSASWNEASISGEYDASAINFYGTVPSPAEMFGFYNSSEGDYSGADTSVTTKLASEAASEVDPKKRQEIWYEAQEILAKEKFFVPICYAPYLWAYQDKINGIPVGYTGIAQYAEAGFTG
jgi:peptide/nickel transport system substrate-binding protein